MNYILCRSALALLGTFEDAIMKGRTYLVGDDFSTADIMMIYPLSLYRRVGLLDSKTVCLFVCILADCM